MYGLGTSEEYMQWRILQGVGEGEVEIPKGKMVVSANPLLSSQVLL